jgi:uncharacterized repeat protein (TIGR03803 family)
LNKLTSLKMACMISVFCAATVIVSSAQTFNTLLDFNPTIGAEPLYMQLIQGTDGNFYGTTFLDGVNGGGTVFRITSAGKLTTLYSFCAEAECADGANPYAGVIQGTDGNFYGTTQEGGSSVNNSSPGTIFKITPAGAVKTIYTFCAKPDCTDGFSPYAGLVQGTDGNFYGTTLSGGTGFSGTIFKVTPAGVLTTLHSFCFSPGCTDGSNPYAGLIQASNGNFYGTTYNGSTPGTIFEITTNGALTTIYSFCSTGVCEDGALPQAGLIQANNGNFYGTTSSGGAHSEGTVFQVTPAGLLKTLYSFCSKTNCTDGYSPVSGLIQATDGNFYGTAFQGGANINYGSVFKITPGGVLTTLHSFAGTDGSEPEGALMQSTNGTFYGVTNNGGTSGAGTVFSLSAGLGPFVETRPTSGKVGSSVIILGTNLSSATSVSFNGTTATFTAVSKTEIKATVPTGATSGKVMVKISQGTLSSNTAFRVVK